MSIRGADNGALAQSLKGGLGGRFDESVKLDLRIGVVEAAALRDRLDACESWIITARMHPSHPRVFRIFKEPEVVPRNEMMSHDASYPPITEAGILLPHTPVHPRRRLSASNSGTRASSCSRYSRRRTQYGTACGSLSSCTTTSLVSKSL